MDVDLVGRDSELALLSGWLDSVDVGGGRVAMVGGEAGIGKSRLVSALAGQARAGGRTVLWGRTTEQDGAPPYWPWLQVLEPIGGRALLEAAPGPDPDSERFARFEAASAALATAADPSLLVVLEDVNRADSASLLLLAHVADRLSAAPVLLVITYRPNALDQVPGFAAVVADLARLPATRRIELGGLGAGAVARLLGDAASTEVVDHVLAASGGNPLYVGELARHLAQGGDLSGVPRSIRDALRARLASRSAGCVEVVQVGAVIGRTFAAGRVATATGRAAARCLQDLDEAVAAGLVEPSGRPGEFRFAHALVRDAVEATLGAAELPAMHRRVAEAIEIYDGTGDDQAADLALHWDAASALGGREIAAVWCERAAAVADRQLAWEQAAQLFERALELSGPAGDPVEEHRRAIGAARARLHCDELAVAIKRCLLAADAARRAGRPDLLAEAVLVPEGRALPPDLLGPAHEALAALPADDHSRRARLHGLLTILGYYVDPSSMAEHCAQAEVEAGLAAEPMAELAAIRARHALHYGPEHAAERLDLARRLGRAARAAGRPSIALWEPLWAIDALVELGRVNEGLAVLPDLRRAVDAAGAPIARWHLARVEAALAQATGRFADALAHGEEARRLFTSLEGPYPAQAIYLGFRIAVELHAGWTRELAEAWDAPEMSAAPPFLGELPILGPAASRAGVGDVDAARRAYDRLSPAEGWSPPPSLWLHMHALRVYLASRLGVLDDLPPLLAALDRHRGLHVGAGGGVVAYEGVVELWLGVGAAALGRWDAADRDLATAGDVARASGTPSFAVHADVERAEALLARGATGDAAHARALCDQARPVAQRLGMPEFLGRIDAVLGRAAAHAGPLSPRESEIAALLTEGRTNREMAAELFLSERTVQNHVQHILTKLGLTNRTQVAAWYRSSPSRRR